MGEEPAGRHGAELLKNLIALVRLKALRLPANDCSSAAGLVQERPQALGQVSIFKRSESRE
jgi:hypothetical protein